MIVFESASAYIESCTTISARIAAIDALIDKLLIASVAGAESSHLDEYWYDDGHIKIRNKYRNVSDMKGSITALQQMREHYAQRASGRMVRLMDAKNFTGRC